MQFAASNSDKNSGIKGTHFSSFAYNEERWYFSCSYLFSLFVRFPSCLFLIRSNDRKSMKNVNSYLEIYIAWYFKVHFSLECLEITAKMMIQVDVLITQFSPQNKRRKIVLRRREWQPLKCFCWKDSELIKTEY